MVLTLKQQRFCEKYIQTGNATKAAIAAGYSPRTGYVMGYENLNKPQIKKYIQQRIGQQIGSEVVSSDEILILLSRIIRGEIVGATVRDRLKAAELLGRYYGLWNGNGGEIATTIKVEWV